MTTPTLSNIEVGQFDPMNLPIAWAKVDPNKLAEVADRLESSVEEQIAQLREMIKENESAKAESNEHDDSTKHPNSPATDESA